MTGGIADRHDVAGCEGCSDDPAPVAAGDDVEEVDQSPSPEAAVHTEPPPPKPGFVIELEKTTWVKSMLVRPPSDKDGRKPRDVVLAFLDDVAADDIEAARLWWYDNNSSITLRFVAGFDAYYALYSGATKIVVGDTGTGKGGIYNIRLKVTTANGDEWAPRMVCKIIDGQWRILRSVEW